MPKTTDSAALTITNPASLLAAIDSPLSKTEAGDLLDDLVAVINAGTKHGNEKVYKKSDLKTANNDWYWDVGNEIERLETVLCVDPGAVYSLYFAAFEAGRSAAKKAA